MFNSAKSTPGLKGTQDQEIRLKRKVTTGAIKKRTRLAELGSTGSLSKSLSPSQRGCKSPIKPTTLGPLRRCIEAMSFLSPRVRKATESKRGKTILKILAITAIVNFG